MTLLNHWQQAMDTLPLIAILRGITPDESVTVAQQLADAGFRLIEIPLNSPEPLRSIENIRKALDNNILIGAGTVLSGTQTKEVINAGGQLIIAPNFSTEVADACQNEQVIYCPGVATPSEAFNALSAGATALKLFPAEIITPDAVKAMRAVLPKETPLIPVGGITPANMEAYLQAGANGFGIGSALYKPGSNAVEIKESADRFTAAFRHAGQR